jgi:hypothetical protein
VVRGIFGPKTEKVRGKKEIKAKLSLCLIKDHAMKTYWGGEV